MASRSKDLAEKGVSTRSGSSTTPQAGVRRGKFPDGDLARRRYDSGLGFLEEEVEGNVLMGTEI